MVAECLPCSRKPTCSRLCSPGGQSISSTRILVEMQNYRFHSQTTELDLHFTQDSQVASIHIKVGKLCSRTVIESGVLTCISRQYACTKPSLQMDIGSTGDFWRSLSFSLSLSSSLSSLPPSISLSPSLSHPFLSLTLSLLPALTLPFDFPLEILKQSRLVFVFPHHLELILFIFDSASSLQS